MRTRAKAFRLAGWLLAGSIVLAGCGGSNDSDDTQDSSGDDTGSADLVVPEAQDKLPADIRDSGKLTVAVDPTFPPANFLDGTTVVGYMPDILTAIGDRLGLDVEYTQTTFDGILTGLQGDRYDTGIIFNDNPEKYSVVSFLDVVSVGEAYMVRSDSTESETLSCGKSVGIGAGATNDIDIANKQSDECKANGEDQLDIQIFPNNDQAVAALNAGRIDAVLSSADNLSYIISKSNGQLKFLGDALEKQFAGVAIPAEDTDLIEALRLAFQASIDDGSYADVMKRWQTEILSVDEAKVNAAESS